MRRDGLQSGAPSFPAAEQVAGQRAQDGPRTAGRRPGSGDRRSVESARPPGSSQRAARVRDLGRHGAGLHGRGRQALHPEVVSRCFRKAVKEAMLPDIRLHDLRHTHATLALRAGIHPKVVSERLGHATVSITLDTYSHAIPAMQEEAAAMIAGLVFADGELKHLRQADDVRAIVSRRRCVECRGRYGAMSELRSTGWEKTATYCATCGALVRSAPRSLAEAEPTPRSSRSARRWGLAGVLRRASSSLSPSGLLRPVNPHRQPAPSQTKVTPSYSASQSRPPQDRHDRRPGRKYPQDG